MGDPITVSVFLWMIFGVVAGFIISLLLGFTSIFGIVEDMLIGMIGAIVIGLLVNFLIGLGIVHLSSYLMLFAFIGAAIPIALKR